MNTTEKIEFIEGKMKLLEETQYIVDALQAETITAPNHDEPESVEYAWIKLRDLIYKLFLYDNKRKGEVDVQTPDDIEVH